MPKPKRMLGMWGNKSNVSQSTNLMVKNLGTVFNYLYGIVTVNYYLYQKEIKLLKILEEIYIVVTRKNVYIDIIYTVYVMW